jgi:general secretion pathway protein E
MSTRVLTCVWPTPSELAAFGQSSDTAATLYRPRENLDGRHAGYRGRTGIYELVAIDETMRRLIHEGASEAELERHARARSASILEDGWRKCVAGMTSSEEVLRVTREG